ncbi:MAG TPA: hypothetical protein VMM18_15700 [Gemmatimonadaceae bacterium]|nr:hypothetical protein [Gemmatimonadaceae bacterium]
MKIVLLVLGSVALLIVAMIAWLIFAAYAGGRRAYRRMLDRIAPVVTALAAGTDPAPEHIDAFARDRETRKVLHDVLAASGRLHLFPRQWLTWEAMAEADLVAWLCHPNEMSAPPAGIEMMARVPAPDGAVGDFFVFRYRMEPPHWRASDGWLAGVAGPYEAAGDPAPHGPGTFSHFEKFDARTAEEHVHLRARRR